MACSLHVWLQHQLRCTHAEAREILGAVEVLADDARDVGRAGRPVAVVVADVRDLPRGPSCPRLPSAPGWTGWSRTRWWPTVDWEPDAIVADVWDWVDQQQPSHREKAEAAAEREAFLQLSPNLFGGGALYGEFDTVGFATVAEALDAPLGPPVAVLGDLVRR